MTNPIITPELLESALAEYFQVEPQDVRSTFERLTSAADRVDEIHPVVTEQWRERQLASLRDEWGEEFDTVYKVVAEDVFPTLTPEQQALYNNADGLRLLAERNRSTIESRLSSSGPNPDPAPLQGAGSIPPTQAQAPGTTNAKPAFKQSQLLGMSQEEWKQNEQAIQQAYQSGSVEMDIN